MLPLHSSAAAAPAAKSPSMANRANSRRNLYAITVSSRCLSQVGDTGRHLLHQETQALLVPSGIVRVGGDREQGPEAAALFVELVDLLHALRRVADDP